MVDQADRCRAVMAGAMVAGPFDPVGIVAGPLDNTGVGPVPALRVEVLFLGLAIRLPRADVVSGRASRTS
jgi:hypothetical protein